MADRCIPDVVYEDEFQISSSEESVSERELPSLSPRSGVLVESVRPSLRSQQKCLTNGLGPDTLLRCRTRRKLTDASVPQIRRDLVRAWRSVLALRIDDAVHAVNQIEPQLDDLPPVIAARFRASTQLLRAAALALQDDSFAALASAMSLVGVAGTDQDFRAASSLCRLGFWQLGNFDAFHALPRHHPQGRGSKSQAISAMLDLSIDAAVALDQLQISTAKRLASDASRIADAVPSHAAGLTALPACITAKVLYEEGALDEADKIIRDRLPAINGEGSIECALGAYVVLTRIARQRGQSDFAALLVHEAEALGERRGWPRLVAACLAERTSMLLHEGRTREARACAEYLDRYAETHGTRSGHSGSEVMRYRTLTRSRVSWAERRASEAVAAMRQLYHCAIERRNLYRGCRLAVELSEMLVLFGESEEADALFSHTARVGAAAGLYQLFLDGSYASGALLKRTYDRAHKPGSADGAVQPFVGSLLSAWNARAVANPSAQSGGRTRDTLTARERGILTMIGQGFSNKRIAKALNISPETVKSHLKRIFMKLAVSTRSEAVSRAGSLGLL